MITFTKEQLIASAHARIEFAEMMLAGELEPLKERTWSIELKLARIALASLEAKSRKLFTCSGCGAEGLDEPLESKCHCNEDGAHWVESVVYTAPPAPVSVPEPIKRNDADGWWMYKGRRVGGGCAEWYNRALDDCRAAMLQGADGNSPVIPDGWILVPVEPTMSQEFAGYRTLTDTGKMSRLMKTRLSNIYRAMIAAAPQQEE